MSIFWFWRCFSGPNRWALGPFTTRPRRRPPPRYLPPTRGAITAFSPPVWSGGWSERPWLRLPDQDVLLALRDRRRRLRRRHRQPQDSLCPGSARRGRIDPALAGVSSFTFRPRTFNEVVPASK